MSAWSSDETTFRAHAGSDGVWYLAGDLDVAAASLFESTVAARLDAREDVALDVADVTFLDSSGIRALLRLAGRVAPRSVVLVNPGAAVSAALDLVNLDGTRIRIEAR